MWLLATPGCGSRLRFPATHGWGVRWWRCSVGPCHSWLRVSGAAPRHSWLGSASRGGGCFRGWGFPVLCVLVARRVRGVPVLLCVVWCVFVVSVLVLVSAWAGLPPVSVCVCVCACVVCWWRAVWCGVVCWWGCGWCVVWFVPRHSWRRFLCATTRHSWLGFAAGGAGRSSPLLAEGLGGGSPPLLAGLRRPRQWGFAVLCVLVARRVRVVPVLVCVVCVPVVCVGGGVGVDAPSASGCVCACVCVCGVLVACGVVRCGVLVGLWLVCGVVGLSPLLAEVPVCYSPPILAGFRCRWWWAFLSTPGCGSRVRFPATPCWDPPAVVVCGFWPLLARACQFWWCVSRVGVSLVVCVCGVCSCARWPCCVVCCVFVVSALLVVWCGGAVGVSSACAGVRGCVCGVPVVCGLVSPPLLVGACGWCLCGCGWCVVWVPRHFWLRNVGAAPRHSWLGSAAVRWWLASCHSWLWGLVAGPRHSWLGSAAGCCGRSLATQGLWPWAWFPATPGWGPLVVVVGTLGALLLGLGVCVSAVWPFVLVWVARGGWCALWLPCVCVCVLAVCG